LKNAALKSIYFVRFKVKTTTIKASARATGGQIFIDFPTPAFAADLGTGKSTGDEIPCTGGPVNAEKLPVIGGKTLKCYLISSRESGQPASIQIVNFDAIDDS
jgi:hypothetical protein